MISVIKPLLGLKDKPFQVPMMEYATMTELVAAAGGEAIALAKFNGFLHAHGTYSEARGLIADTLEEVTGVKRLEKDTGKKAEDGTAITELESEKLYNARVLALKPDAFDKVQALVTQRAKGYSYKDETGAEVKIDPIATDASARVRKPGGPKKLAQKYKDVALDFITGKKNLEKFLARCAKDGLGGFVPVGEKTSEENVTKLGWLCKSFQDAQDAFKGM